MKNLKFSLFALLALFFITSCSEELEVDQISNHQVSTTSDEYISGEDLPEIYNEEDKASIEGKQAIIHEKDKDSGELKFNESNGIKFRSRSVTKVSCGSTKNGTTKGETNTVNKTRGADKVYIINIADETELELKLSKLSSDLDLYLAEVLVDGYGRKLIGNYISRSIKGSNRSEDIKEEVSPGEYFIIVETYGNESNFKLEVDCNLINPQPDPQPRFCENYSNMTASYTNGISRQSNLWHLWRGKSNDGKVLHETSSSSNKVVKFDYRRFGYQDVVREITGLTLNHGWYAMEFDLYVANNGRANFVSEKTGQDGQEQGFGIRISDNTLRVTYRDRVYKARTTISSNEWLSCYASFDLTYNTITLNIDGVTIIMDADSKVSSVRDGRKSIHGINFYGNRTTSKFHVDNVCVTELEPGYDNPWQITSSGEVLDLR